MVVSSPFPLIKKGRQSIGLRTTSGAGGAGEAWAIGPEALGTAPLLEASETLTITIKNNSNHLLLALPPAGHQAQPFISFNPVLALRVRTNVPLLLHVSSWRVSNLPKVTQLVSDLAHKTGCSRL